MFNWMSSLHTVSEPTMISVQSALIFDAVLLLAEAFKQFDPEQLRPERLYCNDNEAWENGNSITNFMRNVNWQSVHKPSEWTWLNGCLNHSKFFIGSQFYSYQTIVQGLTGEVKFDNRGYRSNFAVDVIDLTPSGIEKSGTWNATTGLNITRYVEGAAAIIDNDSVRNKTFIVLTALVNSDIQC